MQLKDEICVLHVYQTFTCLSCDKLHNLLKIKTMKKILLQIFLISSFFVSVKLKAQTWVDVGGGNNIVNGTIISMVADDSNNLYAVGDFYNAKSANYVAKWNGSKWSEVVGTNGKGLKANSDIQSIIRDDSGFLYVAGNFTNSNGKRYVAKYDGTSWSELGTGSNALAANGTIKGLVKGDSGYIYAGGHFTNSNGKYYVAKWNGTSWTELAGSNTLDANNYIHCIAGDDSGHVYAAGAFTNAGGYRHVAKWDGSTWSEVGTGANALNTDLLFFTIVVDSQFNIYAAGEDYYAKNNIVVKWHDTSWSEVGKLSFNLNIYSLAPYGNGELLAAGGGPGGFIAHWDGNDWDNFGSSYLKANDPIYKVLVDKKHDVFVGGGFRNYNLGAYYIAKYDCRPPQPIDSTPASELSICAGNASKLYAVGKGKISWYTEPSGGVLLDTGNFYQTSTFTKDTMFYAQDSNECGTSIERTEIRIKVNPLPKSSSIHKDIKCNGDNNGMASVQATGGAGKYTYNWFPSGGTNNTASALNGGVYICTITDSKLCSINDTVVITEPNAIITTIISQTNNACHGDKKGSVTISTSGGTGSHGYDWSPGGANMPTQGNLPAGRFICTITDSNLCKARDTFYITEPPAINIINVISQNNIKCYGDSNAFVTIKANGGTGNLSYSWSPSGGNAATANNLKAGKYICTVMDSNMCTKTTSVTITEPSKVTASTSSQKDVTCHGGNDGSASLSVSGGTGNLSYSWSPSGGNTATANNLMAGSYTCTITDSNNCTATQQVTIIEPAAIDTAVTQTGFTLTAMAIPATYQWLNCNGNTIINGATNKTYTPISSGSYAAIIMQNTCSDTSGCHTIVIQGINVSNVLYSFEVWPNPVRDVLYIKMPQVVGENTNHRQYANREQIVLYDILGHRVLVGDNTNQRQDGEELYNIYVGHLPKGLYILSVGGNYDSYRKVKVVVE